VLTGNILGGLIGGTFANHQANRLIGTELEGTEIIDQGVMDETGLWIIRFLRWIYALF